MAVAYVDTSALVAVALGETAGDAMARRLNQFTSIMSSNLLEAELRSVYSREKRSFEATRLAGVEWIMPNRPLSPELALVLDTGHMRGADLWHLATALFIAPDPSAMHFVTLDKRQHATASILGFRTGKMDLD